MRSSDDSMFMKVDRDWTRYEPGLRRYIRRRAPTDMVEDLLQEVWLRLYALRDPSSIRYAERYLFVIASSVLAKYRRKGSPEIGIDLVPETEIPCDDISPERIIDGKRSVQNVLDVLNSLSFRTRQVFLLHRFEDMTYRRIAQELEISVSAVEKHMIKALKALLLSDRAPE